jgi:hypothetical protein
VPAIIVAAFILGAGAGAFVPGIFSWYTFDGSSTLYLAAFVMRPDNVLLDKDRAGPHIQMIKSSVITRYYDFFQQRHRYTSRDSSFEDPHLQKSKLNLLGLDFVFSPGEIEGEASFTLSERVYHPLELIVLSKIFFEELQGVNLKGYTSLNFLKSTFMIQIGLFLEGNGYAEKDLGNNEETYTF